MEILLLNLLEDEFLQETGRTKQLGGLVQKLYKLTEKGRAYVARWPAN